MPFDYFKRLYAWKVVELTLKQSKKNNVGGQTLSMPDFCELTGYYHVTALWSAFRA